MAVNEPEKQAEPEPLSTDELLETLKALRGQKDKSWEAHMADHGLDPEKVRRAYASAFRSGNGRIRVAVEAFAWGLQIGAMRLPAFPFSDEERENEHEGDNCNCLACTLRRTIEGGE